MAETTENKVYMDIIEECMKFGNQDIKMEVVEKHWMKYKTELQNYESKDSKLMENFRLKVKIYNDPIHGSIQLNPLEDAIVNTPEFYRLREIKQLGGKSHVFPGAVHTRFEHSIGVCHLAGLFIQHLKERSNPVDLLEADILCVRLAGLCHDLGHGPFSHLFDDVMKKIAPFISSDFKVRKHEEISVMMFKRILLQHPKILAMFKNCGLNVEHVKNIKNMINCSKDIMENADKKKKYLYEIVANKKSGMDVDKWDYFARDCHYLGLRNEFDMGRCIALSSIVKCGEEYHIGFRDKEKRNIYGMFRTRCVLFQKAYYHKTADGVDMMIMDALFHARDIPFQLPLETDGENPALDNASYPSTSQQNEPNSGEVQTRQTPPTSAGNRVSGNVESTSLKEIIQRAMESNDLSGYIQLTDSILRTLMLLPTHSATDQLKLEKVQSIINRIANHHLYKCIEEKSFYSDEYQSPEEIACLKDVSPDDFEIKSIAIKYASEESEDPVAKNMFFFDKDESEDQIPEIKGRVEKPESKLNMPKAFVEYQLRLYSKKIQLNDELKKKMKTEFLEHLRREMFKFEKRGHGGSCQMCL